VGQLVAIAGQTVAIFMVVISWRGNWG